MQPTTVAAHATAQRPNRILIVLAAAWMILSLAIGGAVSAEDDQPARLDTGTTITATQP